VPVARRSWWRSRGLDRAVRPAASRSRGDIMSKPTNWLCSSRKLCGATGIGRHLQLQMRRLRPEVRAGRKAPATMSPARARGPGRLRARSWSCAHAIGAPVLCMRVSHVATNYGGRACRNGSVAIRRPATAWAHPRASNQIIYHQEHQGHQVQDRSPALEIARSISAASRARTAPATGLSGTFRTWCPVLLVVKSITTSKAPYRPVGMSLTPHPCRRDIPRQAQNRSAI